MLLSICTVSGLASYDNRHKVLDIFQDACKLTYEVRVHFVKLHYAVIFFGEEPDDDILNVHCC